MITEFSKSAHTKTTDRCDAQVQWSEMIEPLKGPNVAMACSQAKASDAHCHQMACCTLQRFKGGCD